MRTHLAGALITFGLLLSSACATTGATRAPVNKLTTAQRDAALLMPGEAPQGRGCTVSLSPTPDASAILDVAAYRAAVNRALAGPGAGHALLSVGTDSTGAVRWAHVIRSSWPDSVAALLVAALDGHLRPLHHDGRVTGWQHRLDVTPTAGDDFVRVGRSFNCQPRLRNQRGISLRMQNALASYPAIARIPDRQRTTQLWIHVGRDGTVLGTRVYKSSGRGDVDRIAVDAASMAVFEPALLDGVPRDYWINLPFVVGRSQQPGNRTP